MTNPASEAPIISLAINARADPIGPITGNNKMLMAITAINCMAFIRVYIRIMPKL